MVEREGREGGGRWQCQKPGGYEVVNKVATENVEGLGGAGG